jgi:hypothetical protein
MGTFLPQIATGEEKIKTVCKNVLATSSHNNQTSADSAIPDVSVVLTPAAHGMS